MLANTIQQSTKKSAILVIPSISSEIKHVGKTVLKMTLCAQIVTLSLALELLPSNVCPATITIN